MKIFNNILKIYVTNGTENLADTNCIVDYLNNKLPINAYTLIDSTQIELSVINRIELLAWPSATIEQLNILQNFIQACTLHSLEEEIIVETINIRKNYRLKLPDAIIAATARTKNLTLLTRNVVDFSKILDLAIINPYSL